MEATVKLITAKFGNEPGYNMSAFKPELQWDVYLSAFNMNDSDQRELLLQQSVSDDVEFTNPGGGGKNRSALSMHINDFHEKMPGAYFATDKTYVSQGELLAVWSMYKQDGIKVATGYNFVRLDAAGRFSYMAGLF